MDSVRQQSLRKNLKKYLILKQIALLGRFLLVSPLLLLKHGVLVVVVDLVLLMVVLVVMVAVVDMLRAQLQ
jgi:hypothetical protein